ncbi:MAG: NusG domain II-containing protein [bacterium]
MNNKQLYRISMFDLLLAGLMLASSIGYLLSFHKDTSSIHKKALLYVNNKLIQTVQLSGIEHRSIPLRNSELTVEIVLDKVRIVGSDCPYKICEHTGWITSPGQTIVCVPNNVLIEIAGSSGYQYDAVSY